jgi:glycosyltransferase involved in cell wall biosynthesis
MRKILFVVPSLEPGAAAKQLTLLAPGLEQSECDRRVCVLGRTGVLAQPLHEAGLPVDTLGWTRRFDLHGLLSLRRLVQRFDPDVIHVWGAGSLGAVRAASGRRRQNGTPRRRIVLSSPVPACQPGTPPGWQRRWLLRRADRVVVTGPAEASRCRRLGLSEDRIVVAPPAVAVPHTPPARPTDLRRSLGLPPTCRVIACAGPLEPHKGFLEAVWAYNILRHGYPDVHFVLIGAGSARERLETVARRDSPGGVHFLGCRADAPALLAQADIVVVPSLAQGGINVALEAMAAGKPVLATQLPGLAEIVMNGQTGILVPPGDIAALARKIRLLLVDPDRRRQLGQAAKARAVSQFAVPALCRHVTRLYDSLVN